MAGSRRIEQIDALRALAIGCVLVMHAGHYSGFNATPLGRLTAHLNVGVPVFFVLSGFVLYRPYVSSLLDGRRPPGVLRYAIRRSMRLLPAYWVALFVLALWPGGLWGFRRYGPWPFVGLLQSFRPDWYFGGIPAAWSLSVEWAFSGLLPLFGALTYALGRRQSSRARVVRAALLSAGVGGAGLAFRGVSRALGSSLADTVLGYLVYFALGMLLAVSAAARKAGVWQSTRSFGGELWVAAGVVYLGHCAAFPAGSVAAPLSAWKAVVEQLSFGTVSLLLVLPAVHGVPEATGLQRLLRSRRVVGFGLWSYGMFLWHQPPLAHLATHVSGLESGWTLATLLLVVLPFAVLMGGLSHRLVELPALGLAERWCRALGVERR